MSNDIVKIALPGAGGRMGGMLIREIAAADDLQLVAATDRPESPPVSYTHLRAHET